MRIDLSTREAGSGRPLVLLHAFPLSAAMWLDQREGLAENCRVITPDLRGFGGSPLGADEPDLAEMADDVAALIDRLGHDRVVLGGLSMGGYVAMAFVRRHPERLEGLVLADTRSAADTESAAANRERIAAAVLADPDSTVVVDEVLPALVGPTTVANRALVHGRVRGLVQSAPAYAVAWAERAMARRPDSTTDLAGVTVPTLVIVGAEDTISPPTEAASMAAGMPAATLVEIPAAGHLSAVEAPREFNAAVRAFLGSLPTPAR